MAELVNNFNMPSAAAGQAAVQGVEAANTAQQAKLQALLKKQEEDQQISRLRDLLQGSAEYRKSQGIDEGAPIAPEGASVAAGPYHIGQDLSVKNAATQQKGEDSAYKNAVGHYNKNVTKLQDSLSGIQSTLDSVSDPANRTSVGAAKSSILKMLGMNRFNQAEADAVLPPNMSAKAGMLWQKLGNDDSKVLDPGLQKDVRDLSLNHLQSLQQRHGTLKDTALQTYSGSSYSKPDRAQSLSQSLGTPFENQLNTIKQKYYSQPQQDQQAATNQQINPQKTGILDKMKAAYQALQGQSQAPQAPAAAPSAGGMDFRAQAQQELLRRQQRNKPPGGP